MEPYRLQLFVGTYTDGGAFVPTASGQGIMRCRFDTATGAFSELDCAAEVVNPSWIHLTDHGRRLFAVSECFDRFGQVVGFDVENDGRLKAAGSRCSHGLATCHLIATDTHIYAASYLDGRLSVHARKGARVSEAMDVIAYEGSGPDKGRQEAAHAHQAVLSPNGRWLYVCDLGSDCIWRHALDQGVVEAAKPIFQPAGSGPRHLIFHPEKPLAWVVCELTACILTFSWNPASGELGLRHTLRFEKPEGFGDCGAGAAIHLHPSRKLLAISERSAHSVLLFSLSDDGELTPKQRIQNRGKTPRDFAFTSDGRWLLVVYQDSHAIESHAIDRDLIAAPAASDHLELRSPVCITLQSKLQ